METVYDEKINLLSAALGDLQKIIQNVPVMSNTYVKLRETEATLNQEINYYVHAARETMSMR